MRCRPTWWRPPRRRWPASSCSEPIRTKGSNAMSVHGNAGRRGPAQAPRGGRGRTGHVQLRQAGRRQRRQGLRQSRPQGHRARRRAGREEERRREQPALPHHVGELLDGAQGPRALLRSGRRADRRVRPARGHDHAALSRATGSRTCGEEDLEILQVSAFSEGAKSSGRTDVSEQHFKIDTAEHFNRDRRPA